MMVTDFKWEAPHWGSFFIGPNPDDLYLFVFQVTEDGEVQGRFDEGWGAEGWVTDVVNQHMSARPTV